MFVGVGLRVHGFGVVCCYVAFGRTTSALGIKSLPVLA